MKPIETAIHQFKGKNVLIFGLGLLGGGEGDTRFFSSIGSNVRVTDAKSPEQLQSTLTALQGLNIDFSLGGHTNKDIDWADVIVRNPSVPENHELLLLARQKGKRIVMRTSLFVELANTQTIGVTGTRGKTTTTMMIYELVKKLSNKQVFLGGNVAGVSDLELLATIENPAESIVVLELSSWQLQGFAESKISPNIGVITNLYPDHLNRYNSITEYYEDKHTIIKYQHDSDYAVLNSSQPQLKTWATQAKSKIAWFSPASIRLKVPGIHNQLNAAAAMTVASILGYNYEEVVKVLEQFSGVPYRLQTIACKNNVTYINDTTSTTPIATITALNAYPQKPILILGGSDKNLPLEDMIDAVNTKAKYVILLPGTGTQKIETLLNPNLIVFKATSMEQAVRKSAELAKSQDIVILSPGFASFGLFNNEFHRGDEFNRCVQNL